MRFLMTGATGFLGRHLFATLRAAGHHATVLARDAARATAMLPGARVHIWNGVVGLPPVEAFDEVDVVVNLVGESVAKRWTEERKLRFRDSRVLPTRALVERLATLPAANGRPSALISMAGTGIYGDRGDELVTETSAPGTGFLAKLAQEWEGAALDAEKLGMRVVIMRSGAVLGRDGGMLPTILRPFRLGLGARFGDGRQYFPWIHLTDLMGLMMHAAGHEGMRGPVNAVAPEPTTNAELVAALARALGKSAPFALPRFALKLAFGSGMAEEMLLGGQRASPVRALEAGYEFRFPLLAGALRDLVASPSAVAPAPGPSDAGASGPSPGAASDASG